MTGHPLAETFNRCTQRAGEQQDNEFDWGRWSPVWGYVWWLNQQAVLIHCRSLPVWWSDVNDGSQIRADCRHKALFRPSTERADLSLLYSSICSHRRKIDFSPLWVTKILNSFTSFGDKNACGLIKILMIKKMLMINRSAHKYILEINELMCL